MNHKVGLIILDGWGIANDKLVSAPYFANIPFIEKLQKTVPNVVLSTSGLEVGLPKGQMGNSEVGHMNLGAGRIVYQNLVKLNLASENKEFEKLEKLNEAIAYAKQNNKNIHIMGLLSDGGIHSHNKHLYAICDVMKNNNLKNVFIHAFTDGRDCDPKSGKGFISELLNKIQNTNIKLASIIGRYYAMDRDKRWERIKKAYNLLIYGEGFKTQNPIDEIQKSYDNKITDEFIMPISITNENNEPISVFTKGDVVIFFNFRADRARQITHVLTQKSELEMCPIDIKYISMTQYDESFKKIDVLFNKDNLQNTLGEVLEKYSKKQIRIAETEKYPHVTYFFSGGREKEFKGEKRILVPSPKVSTYDLKPEMSAYEVKNEIIKELNKKEADFICLNFANPDMVGHTGVFEAAVKACETVDKCLQQVIETGINNGYTFIILADHGNVEKMKNKDGSPNTAHTNYKVPCYLVNAKGVKSFIDGKLGDIAPTICQLMNMTIPTEMTGKSLVKI